MNAFVLAQLAISDRAKYERYARAVPATLEPYGGTVVVADDAPHVLEGAWANDRVVMIGFPGPDDALAWAASDAYRRIAPLREQSTTTTAVLLSPVVRPRIRPDRYRLDRDEETDHA
jgi:uncharacterized protein (DUF1330 family)